MENSWSRRKFNKVAILTQFLLGIGLFHISLGRTHDIKKRIDHSNLSVFLLPPEGYYEWLKTKEAKDFSQKFAQ